MEMPIANVSITRLWKRRIHCLMRFKATSVLQESRLQIGYPARLRLTDKAQPHRACRRWLRYASHRRTKSGVPESGEQSVPPVIRSESCLRKDYKIYRSKKWISTSIPVRLVTGPNGTRQDSQRRSFDIDSSQCSMPCRINRASGLSRRADTARRACYRATLKSVDAPQSGITSTAEIRMLLLSSRISVTRLKRRGMHRYRGSHRTFKSSPGSAGFISNSSLNRPIVPRS